MKRLLLTLSLIASSISLLQAQATQEVHRYEMKFGEFHELRTTDGINVEYYTDPSRAGLAEFFTDASLASAIIFQHKNGKLTISLASRDTVYTYLPTVRVYSSFLSVAKNEGDSLMTINRPAPGPKFQAKVEGNGRLIVKDITTTQLTAEVITGKGSILVNGKATSAKYTIAGSGSVKATELEATDVSATVAGTGAIYCWPVKTLSVGGLGSGKVYYRGTPADIKKKFISKVKVLSLEGPQVN